MVCTNTTGSCNRWYVADLINSIFPNKIDIKKTLDNILFVDHDLIDSSKGKSTFNFSIPIHITHTVFQPIVDQFLKMAGDDYYVIDFWANIYKNQGFVKSHNHISKGRDLFFDSKTEDMRLKTGVYYFTKPEKSGNLVIEDKEIMIKENDFIIFGSSLNHYSMPNETNEDRIIFSINMGYKVHTKWRENGRFYRFL
mgnify:CR=1 FL=1|jgi:hypothetical protein